MTIKLRKTIEGNREASDFFLEESITLAGKMERTYNDVVLADGEIVIPFTKMGTLSKIIVSSTDPMSLTLLSSGDVSNVLPLDGYNELSISAVYAAQLTGISISSPSTTAQDIQVILLGV